MANLGDVLKFKAEEKARKNPKLELDRIMEAMEADDDSGFCLACGEQAYGVEPDARGYACDSCGALMVYGAQECLMMVAC